MSNTKVHIHRFVVGAALDLVTLTIKLPHDAEVITGVQVTTNAPALSERVSGEIRLWTQRRVFYESEVRSPEPMQEELSGIEFDYGDSDLAYDSVRQTVNVLLPAQDTLLRGWYKELLMFAGYRVSIYLFYKTRTDEC